MAVLPKQVDRNVSGLRIRPLARMGEQEAEELEDRRSTLPRIKKANRQPRRQHRQPEDKNPMPSPKFKRHISEERMGRLVADQRSRRCCLA